MSKTKIVYKEEDGHETCEIEGYAGDLLNGVVRILLGVVQEMPDKAEEILDELKVIVLRKMKFERIEKQANEAERHMKSVAKMLFGEEEQEIGIETIRRIVQKVNITREQVEEHAKRMNWSHEHTQHMLEQMGLEARKNEKDLC